MNTAAVWKVDQTKILGRAEIATVLADVKRKAKRSINTRQNLVVFRLSSCCGLRASEIVWLQWADVDLTNGWLHVRCKPHLGWGPKSDQDRAVPAHPRLVEFLKAWREEVPDGPEDWVCPMAPRERFICRQSALVVRQLFAHARVAVPGAAHKLHLLRGTFATRYLRNGGDLESLRDVLGHSDLATTAVYLQATAESKRRGLDGL